MNWDISKSTAGFDIDEIIKLRKVVFPGEDPDKETQSYWNWEFKNNFYGEAEVFLAKEKDNAVGHYGVIPQEFIINGNTVRGGLVVDVMTHPDYRKQGMFTAIGKYSLSRTSTDFAIGYPIRKEVLPGHLNIGWEIVKNIPVFIFPLNFENLLNNYNPIKFLNKIIGYPANGLYSLLFNASGKKNDLVIKEVKSLGEITTDFFEEQKKHFHIYQKKSSAYLNWRFDENKLIPYEKFIVSDPSNDEILAYFIVRNKKIQNMNCLNIVDIELKKRTLQIVKTIINFITSKARKEKYDCVAYMLLDDGYISKQLKYYGMMESPFKFRLIIHNNKTENFIKQFMNSKSIHLNWSDTDVM